MKKILFMSIALTAMLTACGSKKVENPTGNWTAAAPIATTVIDAKSATKTTAFDFRQDGTLTYAADYTVATDSSTYTVRASIQGTWTAEQGEDDDYLLSFDSNTLAVNGTDAPELGPVTDEFLTSLASLTSIDDVEVTNQGTHLTFETHHPKAKYHFVKQ